MIFSALPGFRETRSPVIIGYVTLVALWLLLYEHLPTTMAEARNVVPELVRLANIVGVIAVAAAVSFFAYLIGGLVLYVAGRVFLINSQPIEIAGGFRQFMRGIFSATGTQAMNDLELRLRELVNRELDSVPKHDDRASVRSELTVPVGASRAGFRVRWTQRASDQVLEPDVRARVEIKSGRIDDRILAINSELFNEISRSRSEAELRVGLVVPLWLVAFGITVNVDLNTLWKVVILVLSAVFVGVLWLDALQHRSRSRNIAMRAVVDGLVTTPTIDLIRLRKQQLSEPQEYVPDDLQMQDPAGANTANPPAG